MKYAVCLFILAILLSCGKEEGKDIPKLNEKLKAALIERSSLYLSLVPNVQEAISGFIDTEKCDSLLFSSLLLAAGAKGNIYAAEEAPGKWLRRPKHLEECYSSGNSRSEISRDMFIGLFYYLWSVKDLAAMDRIWDYGKANDWWMGAPVDISTTYLNASMRGTLSKMRKSLGSDDVNFADTLLGPTYTERCEGFECHLQAIHMILRYEAYGELGGRAKAVANAVAARNPNNALFTSISDIINNRCLDDAAERLLSSPYHPEQGLHSLKEAWPFQREDGDSGLAEQGNKQHSNGDWLFTAYLILKHSN